MHPQSDRNVLFRFSPLFLFAFLFLVHVVSAYYDIDDADDSTIRYSWKPGGPAWGPFASNGQSLSIHMPDGAMMPINASECFDQTYTYAACTASDECTMEFTFDGSGVAIYVLQAGPQGMSASVSIDSGNLLTNTLNAPPPPSYYKSRVQLFNIQSLASGSHTLTMNVLDWNGGFSGMMFDYAEINQTMVVPVTSTLPTYTASPTVPISSQSPGFILTSTVTLSPSAAGISTAVSTASTSQRAVNIGPIVGGAIGGTALVVVTAAFAALLRYRQRWLVRRSPLMAKAWPNTMPPRLFQGELDSSTDSHVQTALIALPLNAAARVSTSFSAITSPAPPYPGRSGNTCI